MKTKIGILVMLVMLGSLKSQDSQAIYPWGSTNTMYFYFATNNVETIRSNFQALIFNYPDLLLTNPTKTFDLFINYRDSIVTTVTNYPPTAVNYIQTIKDRGILTNVVNLLITDGTFCSIRGHRWQMGCGVEGCLVYHPYPIRHCAICGITQSQTPGEWK